jgi:hypothetical protein
MSISVSHWMSHPDLDNDDCSTGEDFATEAEAVAFYKLDPSDKGIEYVEIDLSDEDCQRLGITRCRKSGNFRPSTKRDSGSWQREIANEAGMLGGVHAYNDAMGYDSEEYVPESYQ